MIKHQDLWTLLAQVDAFFMWYHLPVNCCDEDENSLVEGLAMSRVTVWVHFALP